MADYEVEGSANGGYGEDQQMFGDENQEGEYNDYGAEQNPVEFETDVPVSQEDAWAVIS